MSTAEKLSGHYTTNLPLSLTCFLFLLKGTCKTIKEVLCLFFQIYYPSFNNLLCASFKVRHFTNILGVQIKDF